TRIKQSSEHPKTSFVHNFSMAKNLIIPKYPPPLSSLSTLILIFLPTNCGDMYRSNRQSGLDFCKKAEVEECDRISRAWFAKAAAGCG
ncbi:MAG: hypothetical protein LAT55_05845, partial [Opitutales bacterium]|nr:hypothetical protein [Opitutales bacterium]